VPNDLSARKESLRKRVRSLWPNASVCPAQVPLPLASFELGPASGCTRAGTGAGAGTRVYQPGRAPLRLALSVPVRDSLTVIFPCGIARGTPEVSATGCVPPLARTRGAIAALALLRQQGLVEPTSPEQPLKGYLSAPAFESVLNYTSQRTITGRLRPELYCARVALTWAMDSCLLGKHLPSRFVTGGLSLFNGNRFDPSLLSSHLPQQPQTDGRLEGHVAFRLLGPPTRSRDPTAASHVSPYPTLLGTPSVAELSSTTLLTPTPLARFQHCGLPSGLHPLLPLAIFPLQPTFPLKLSFLPSSWLGPVRSKQRRRGTGKR